MVLVFEFADICFLWAELLVPVNNCLMSWCAPLLSALR